jgi:hypothetical protein
LLPALRASQAGLFTAFYASKTSTLQTISTSNTGMALVTANDPEANRSQTAHAQLTLGAAREVNDPASNERASIVDANGNRAAGPLMTHLHEGAERQRAVCRCDPIRAVTLASRGEFALVVP